MCEEQTGYDAACFTADRRLMLTAYHMYVHTLKVKVSFDYVVYTVYLYFENLNSTLLSVVLLSNYN